jgi:hypothetical protein
MQLKTGVGWVFDFFVIPGSCGYIGTKVGIEDPLGPVI